MSQGRNRAENRAYIEAEILRLGRAQLDTRSPAELSLREIARSLGLASSAVYRYVSDRDTLLTRLIVDAYKDLAESVEQEVARSGGKPDSEKLFVFGSSMRTWAVNNPTRWALIYGTPVPGYAAPASQTTPPGTRLMALLTGIVATGKAIGDEPTGAYRQFLEAGVSEFEVATDAHHGATTVDLWCAIVGAISMEVFGQLGPEAGGIGEVVLQRVLHDWGRRLFP